MEIIQEIGLQVIEILTLIFGILGMTFSAMLMVSPKLTENLSHILNRSVNLDEKIGFLDKDISMTDFIYSRHVVVGLLLITGSALALILFHFSLDIAKFAEVFLGSPQQVFFGEILINSIFWFGKITCLFGLIFGSLLMSAPEKMKRWENKLNLWFEIRPIIEKLDQSTHKFDTFFFRHPLPVGMTGVIISFLILALSIINLLD